MIGTALHHGTLALDKYLAGIQVPIFERKGLITVLFHVLFEDEKEIQRHEVSPHQSTTVGHFAQCIEYFLEAGYRFPTLPQVAAGLNPTERHVLLTFDDGYFNNTRALPVLEQYGVSATFFISAHHVKFNRPYWWDVHYAARTKEGAGFDEIAAECFCLQQSGTPAAERAVCERLGLPELPSPASDLSRPLTPAELRQFAAHPRVVIGNHTLNHAILTTCDAATIRFEIQQAQIEIEAMSGVKPLGIAYPNGNVTPGIIAAARDAGLQLGFSTLPRKEYLPGALEGDARMALGRHCLWGNDSVAQQCRTFRSDLMLNHRYHAAKAALKRACRRQG